MERPLKMTGLMFSLISTKPGEDLSFNRWHDEDHIPENRALRGVFHAQRYQAPAAYRTLRGAIPEGVMRYAGGAYCMIYYFERPVDDVAAEMGALAKDLWAVKRMHLGGMPVWSSTFDLIRVHVRKDHFLDAGAFPAAPHQGIFVSLRELLDPSYFDELNRWEDEVHEPEVLETPGFGAIYRLRGHGENQRYLLNISYLEGDPPATVAALRARIPGWRERGHWLEPNGRSRLLFSGPYQPIVPGQYGFIGT